MRIYLYQLLVITFDLFTIKGKNLDPGENEIIISGEGDESNHFATRARRILWSAFEDYTSAFAKITGRARQRFEHRDWEGVRRDTVERLDLYPAWVLDTKQSLENLLGHRYRDRTIWLKIKAQYGNVCRNRCDTELALTFYNSVNRKVFRTVGVQPQMEFLAPQNWKLPSRGHQELFSSVTAESADLQVIRKILLEYNFQTDFYDLDGDARLCAERIRKLRNSDDSSSGPAQIKMIKQPFFRDMGAYLIGSIRWRDSEYPLVFALNHKKNGLFVDALLVRQEDLRILFSFSRDYFHVNTPCPGSIVNFLKQLMPLKRIAELDRKSTRLNSSHYS